jgi:transposase
MQRHTRDRQTKPQRSPSVLGRLHPDAAGIDCGSAEHYVAVPPDRDADCVRSFPTFTADLGRLVAWLTACRITSVAMEATGVYWIPLYEMLEAQGFQVLLVNARHVKNVPGRKSDVADCEWLRDLHIVGLVRGSFRPTASIVALRAYLRHRETLIQHGGSAIQRMQKALIQMNLQRTLVVSDLSGETGLRIVRDIVAGHTDPQALARHRNYRCRASEGEIVAALTGHYQPAHVFALRQNLEAYDFVQRQLVACDAAIETHLHAIAAASARATAPAPAARRRQAPYRNAPRFDIRVPLYQLSGADLSQLDGIGPYNALRLISEIGTDMTRWPTEKHFTAWLTLAPQNKVSGGRLLSSRTRPSANRAAAILRLAVSNLGRSQTALGAFYRRLSVRIGKAKAITATARKLAILVYRTLKDGLVYRDPGAAAYDARNRDRVIRMLRRRAADLGLGLIDLSTGEVSRDAVS